MRIGERWMKWTFGEASAKTASKLFSKVVGMVSTSFGHVFFATAVIGLVQTIVGFCMARAKGTKLLTDPVDVAGACMFGFFATLATVFGFIVFLLGGNIGVNVFIVTLSIIPGALIDRLFFKKHLSGRQWLGLAVGIFAGYCILGLPSFKESVNLPLWVWLSFAMAFFVAINQGITQKVKKIDPFVKNFWGGFTTLILSVGGLAVVGSLSLVFDFSGAMKKLWMINIVIGFIVVAMWTSNLYSYKEGASIALKKLVMNGSYLIMAMTGGILIFDETISISKGMGIMIYFIAFVLMDQNTWSFLFSRPSNK